MIIKCTSCGSQAKLPDSKEGAKVKCPSCGHIYVARPAGAKGASKNRGDDPTSKFVMIGVIVVGVAIVAIMASKSGGNREVIEEEPEVVVKKEATEYVDPLGWEGPAVKLARSLHAAAFAVNETKIGALLDRQAAYEHVPNEEFAGEELAPVQSVEFGASSGEPGADEAAGGTEEAPAAEERPAWGTLDEMARLRFQDELVEAVMTDGEEGAVRDWDPFDGKVEYTDGVTAIVRLKVVYRNANEGLPDRWTQWYLKNIGGAGGADDQWRWTHVERWVTPEEAAQSRRGLRVKAEKKTLSDGSKVYESKIRAIPFDADVTADRQARLTKLVDDLVTDIDAPPRVRNPISEELTIAGKAAIPALLTKMSTIVETMSSDMDKNEEDRIRLNFIHQILEEITEHRTTFAVAVEMGSTQERIESGIKQWFGWYDRKYKRFQETDEPAGDPLLNDPDFKPETDEERRLYEKAKQEAERERKKKADGN
ncbi:hypothetical protein Poly30_25740 [Planctomycetes bacterium Poly30]|uniref:Zinc finger/thioredoxin putative domain-containing protein n=1 Tax=Saltatorellus ferox TaxID=2528018 RepID=A0A518ESL9_9BACT|nr:hypothetical protein Poly30_25740 [Planctomycetes bacterium Poly30]